MTDSGPLKFKVQKFYKATLSQSLLDFIYSYQIDLFCPRGLPSVLYELPTQTTARLDREAKCGYS